MYQRKVDVDMLNAINSVLATFRVSPSSEQRDIETQRFSHNLVPRALRVRSSRHAQGPGDEIGFHITLKNKSNCVFSQWLNRYEQVHVSGSHSLKVHSF